MIPFITLNRNAKELSGIKDAVDKFIFSGDYILGRALQKYEKRFAKFTNSKYAIGVGSGTDAIYMIIKALGLKKIALCSSAPLPCAQAIKMANAEIVFIDTYKRSGLIDIEQLKREINTIDGILAVHLYGQTENIKLIKKIIKNKNIKLIEDCSQSIGTYIDNIHTGNFAIASAFSFYPTKNLGCFGDGGMIITNNKKLSNIFYKMRNYGQGNRYSADIFGINSRLDDIQSVILNEKIKHIIDKNNKRKKIAMMYRNKIKNPLIELPDNYYFENSNFHIFPIFSKYRNNLQSYLLKNGIGSAIHYPIPLHKQEYFLAKDCKCKNAEKLSKMELSIPVFPELKKYEIIKIINILNGFKI